MTDYRPGPDSELALRDIFSAFATGVTVVTCQSEVGPLGMTANSFSSVSLDPPLVLWCPAKSSSRYQSFVSASRFAIHVLDADQRDICRRFANEGLRFDDLTWSRDDTGVPVIEGCLARLECRLRDVHDAGDHAIVLGEVTAASRRDGTPLIFANGRYGGFTG